MNDNKDNGLAARITTRPQDWAPAVRVHLFGLDSLMPEEFAREGARMSAGRPAYGDEVYRRAAEAARRMRS